MENDRFAFSDEGIPITYGQLKEGVLSSMNKLKQMKAPKSFGYNDMGILVSFVRGLDGRVFSESIISDYLHSKQSELPNVNLDLDSQTIWRYLQVLYHDAKLLYEHCRGDGAFGEYSRYSIRSQVGKIIIGNLNELKSPNIPEKIFREFDQYEEKHHLIRV